MRKSVVFLGAKPIAVACLSYLIQHQDALGIDIIAVGTHDRPEYDTSVTVASIAAMHQLPIIAYADEIPECDIIYSVQYHQILQQHHIDRARQLAVNLHLAPLPEYRGCNQFSFAIMNEEKAFGVSIHRIDVRIDHGDLLYESRFPIRADIWVDELLEQCVQEGIALFERTISSIVRDTYEIIDKDRNAVSRLYYRKDIQGLKVIDWADDIAYNYRKIRATMMPGFEPPYFYMGTEKVYITRSIINKNK